MKALLAAAAANPKASATRVAFLKNVLLREPAYRLALAEVSTPRAEVGQPVRRLLRLKNPSPDPSPADDTLSFTTETLPNAAAGSFWTGAVSLTGGNPVVASATAGGLHLSGSGADLGCRAWSAGTAKGSPGPDSVAAADLHYGFRMDFALAGPRGLCLLRQDGGGRFTDVTAAARLPPALLRTPLYGVWPADVDTDGDLDLVVAPVEGQPIVLRNNTDGTFTPRALFDGVARARGFVWADLDGEGVPDAAFLDDAGIVTAFINLRGGVFRAEPLPPHYGRGVAIATADQDADSFFDLLVLGADGGVTRASRNSRDGSWRETAMTRVDPPGGLEPGAARLLTADLDNNAATDLVVAGPPLRVFCSGCPAAPSPRSRRLCPSACRGRPTSTAMEGSSCWGSIRQDARLAPSAREQRPIDGRCSARAQRRRPAISGSTRSAWAVRSSCDPDCICRSR